MAALMTAQRGNGGSDLGDVGEWSTLVLATLCQCPCSESSSRAGSLLNLARPSARRGQAPDTSGQDWLSLAD
jgi:hypothetical protein